MAARKKATPKKAPAKKKASTKRTEDGLYSPQVRLDMLLNNLSPRMHEVFNVLVRIDDRLSALEANAQPVAASPTECSPCDASAQPVRETISFKDSRDFIYTACGVPNNKVIRTRLGQPTALGDFVFIEHAIEHAIRERRYEDARGYVTLVEKAGRAFQLKS